MDDSKKQTIFTLLLILFAGMSNATLCYQEFANKSESCGAMGGGTYTATGGWYGSSQNSSFDGNWSTIGYSAYGSSAYLYTNYTIPAGTTSATWQVGWHTDLVGDVITNITIPAGCIASTVLETRTQLLMEGLKYWTNFSCNNGTGWQKLNQTNNGEGWESHDGLLEEGVFWNITANSSSTSSGMSALTEPIATGMNDIIGIPSILGLITLIIFVIWTAISGMKNDAKVVIIAIASFIAMAMLPSWTYPIFYLIGGVILMLAAIKLFENR